MATVQELDDQFDDLPSAAATAAAPMMESKTSDMFKLVLGSKASEIDTLQKTIEAQSEAYKMSLKVIELQEKMLATTASSSSTAKKMKRPVRRRTDDGDDVAASPTKRMAQRVDYAETPSDDDDAGASVPRPPNKRHDVPGDDDAPPLKRQAHYIDDDTKKFLFITKMKKDALYHYVHAKGGKAARTDTMQALRMKAFALY